jgi:hypothetical protein
MFVRLEVLAAVNIQITGFLDVTPCSLVDSTTFRNPCLHLQGEDVILKMEAAGQKTMI